MTALPRHGLLATNIFRLTAAFFVAILIFNAPAKSASAATVSTQATQSITLTGISAEAADLGFLEVVTRFYDIFNVGSAGYISALTVDVDGSAVAVGDSANMALGQTLTAAYSANTGLPAPGTRFSELNSYVDLALSLGADASGPVTLAFSYSASSAVDLVGDSGVSGGFGEASTSLYDASDAVIFPVYTYADIASAGNAVDSISPLPFSITLQPGDMLSLYLDASLSATATGVAPTPVPTPSALLMFLTGLLGLFTNTRRKSSKVAVRSAL